METKGAGQEGMEKCLGNCQGPNWAVEPLVVVVADHNLMAPVCMCRLPTAGHMGEVEVKGQADGGNRHARTSVISLQTWVCVPILIHYLFSQGAFSVMNFQTLHATSHL
jgi:hypothetical protein